MHEGPLTLASLARHIKNVRNADGLVFLIGKIYLFLSSNVQFSARKKEFEAWMENRILSSFYLRCLVILLLLLL